MYLRHVQCAHKTCVKFVEENINLFQVTKSDSLTICHTIFIKNQEALLLALSCDLVPRVYGTYIEINNN